MMLNMQYTIKQFNLPPLNGLSEKQIATHLGLYEGYVKQVNFIGEKLGAIRAGTFELDPYIVAELRRRFAFERNGAYLHELYFSQFENGAQAMKADGALATAASAKYGGQGLEAHVREVAGTRGIGWAITYADPARKTLITSFVTDHEVGHMAGLPVLLALDLWEHAYMADYLPAEKKNYIDAFFANVNWGVVEKRFEDAR